MELTHEQDSALQSIRKWYKTCQDERKNLGGRYSKPFFYLAGFAGTGKTTLVGEFQDYISGRVCYAAYTGKAAMQMRKQGVRAQTIHSLCYKPITRKEGDKWITEFDLDPESELVFAKLLVLDECSMVGKDMGNDLLTFKVPILVLGDPGQLPPIKSLAYFTGRRPDIMLKEVHRQALDSPILRVATEVREGKALKRTEEEGLIIYPMGLNDDQKQNLLVQCEQALTGTNKTRMNGNRAVRRLSGIQGKYPALNERLVCLRNNRRKGLFNGLIVNTTSEHEELDTSIKFDIDTELNMTLKDVYVLKDCFSDYKKVQEMEYRERAMYDEFDYGYVLTVHKAQGSQWDNVLIIDDGFLRWDRDQRKRWLYTAITRAAVTLTIVRP